MVSNRSKRQRAKLFDSFVKIVMGTCALLVGLIIPTTTFVILLLESKIAYERFGFFKFIAGKTWDPVSESFGALPMVIGTIISTTIAIIIAIPVALGIAIFITEIAPKPIKVIVSQAVSLLGIIPSIIYGIWGFMSLAPFMAEKIEPLLQKAFHKVPLLGKLFAGTPTGLDVITTGLVLSIMVIPFMSSIVEETFEMIDPMIKESAYGLGATKWEVIRKVVIPSSINGIAGGLILSTGRALGETMAVAFIAGNTFQIPRSLFDSFTTITVALANQFTEADTDAYLSSLYLLALVLFTISFVAILISKILINRVARRYR